MGVEISEGRATRRVLAGEVILCGGAINSPQLLQLSGVGEPEELRRVGVRPIHDLAGVGENLQDHLEVYIQYASKLPVSAAPALKLRNRPKVGLEWLLFKRGPGATNHFEAGGFIRSNADVVYPNLMFHFLPLAIRWDRTTPGGHAYQGHISSGYTEARGTVKITSTNPRAHPELRFNYLETDQERREWIEGVRWRAQDPQPASVRSFQWRGAIARAESGDGRRSARLGGSERRERNAPVLHVQDGGRRGRGS